jgi:hypothetical protein
LFVGIMFLFQFLKGKIVAMAEPFVDIGEMNLHAAENSGSIIQLMDPSFLSAPIATVPLENLKVSELSKTLSSNIELKGAFGNPISDAKIEWITMNGETYSYGEQLSTELLAFPDSILAIVHDPALQFIAIAFISAFCILFTIAFWRYRKNKVPKL